MAIQMEALITTQSRDIGSIITADKTQMMA